MVDELSVEHDLVTRSRQMHLRTVLMLATNLVFHKLSALCFLVTRAIGRSLTEGSEGF